MAYQGTNLVPSSQQDSCTMHGFAAAEGGLRPGCGVAFPSAEALGHDFGTLFIPDPVINDTDAGYGPSYGYRNGLFNDGVAAEVYTGHTDQLSASLCNNAGATAYVDNDWNSVYTPNPNSSATPAVNNIAGSGSGNGYGVSTGYRDDVFTADIAANGYTGYADQLGAPFGNNASATTRVGNDGHTAYTATPAVNNIVGSGSGNGYGVSTGYRNDMFTADIATNAYTGYADQLDAPLGNNAGATPYVDYGWNPAYTPAPVVNNIVGSGSGTGSGMPPFQPNTGGYHPVGPPTPIGPRRFVCTHPNCSSTFGRPSDLARHAKKHETNPLRYPCPVRDCAFTGAKAFLRHDKLLSHGRNAHGMQF